MVFDAHDRAFALFKGACQRGIYDNMKTAVETSAHCASMWFTTNKGDVLTAFAAGPSGHLQEGGRSSSSA
jgi:hypothetical protein